MDEYKIGNIIKVQVVGFQPYGIFIKAVDDESYSGLIHISEISYDFVKDITQVANKDDIVYAKILDLDAKNKHLKLSIKATLPKNRYKTNYVKVKEDKKLEDFSKLEEKLPVWISEGLKEGEN